MRAIQRHPLWKKFQGMNKNIQVASYVAGAITLWMVSGIFGCSEKHVQTAAEAAIIPTVTVQTQTAEPYVDTLRLFGRSDAKVRAQVAARTTGSVTQLNHDVGSMVKAGETLLTIDIATRKADLKAAKARLNETKALYNAAKKLKSEGFQSATKLAEREANMAAAEQQVAQIEQDIAYTTVAAPVTGRIEARNISQGDFVTIGQSLFTLIGQDTYQLVAFAAQNEQALITEGAKATARLANGQQVEGLVSFISRLGDETTRTYRVEVDVDGKQYQIPVGMTATIEIPLQETTAHLVPHSALVFNDEGSIGVRYVEEGIVKFAPVTNFRDQPEGFHFTGLPQEAQIIIRGQNAVNDGDKVHVKEEETN